ncbi:phage tail terminator protein [Ancylobacter lacus]|uniref:phage tail terminator protein n=1 Tax=Ancylobacter lacus TaxID=2579970 RepID=UPI001BCF3961|nr:hypothetical protein [Ancylobacter lacus]MBS7539757.1 hypothetical protein [Ancylobacter lacus]
MSTAAIRDALTGLLEAIPDIGRVHAYERFAASEKAFIELYTADGRVRGWRVSRVNARRRRLASGATLVTSRWAIIGLLAVVDGDQSEIVAGALADAIVAAERVDPTLGGIVRGLPVDGASGLQLLGIEPVMFAGVLCHRVALQLDVQTIEAAPNGDLELIDNAAGRLIGAVVDRLGAQTGGFFGTIEGRLAWDPEDVPPGLSALVIPVADRAQPNPETIQARQRVDRSIAVIVVAPADFTAAQGALAAGGLEALRDLVRSALLGWGDGPAGVVDVPLLYAGGGPVDVAAGYIAWRDVFTPSIYIEE